MNDAARRALFEAWFSGSPCNGDREALIRKSGYTKGRVSQLFDPNQQFGERAARSLAHRLGLPAEFFNSQGAEKSSGDALRNPAGEGAAAPPAASNIQTPNVKLSGVDPVDLRSSEGAPLISWIRAGSWADVADPYLVGEAEDWLPCPVRHGPRTYCLKVRGDSMHNPSGRPSYADGDIIFVDPDRPANPGDRVIVRLDDHAEATFKQLLIEDGRKLLKALNPEWSPRYIEINGNATIAGVIIGKWVPE